MKINFHSIMAVGIFMLLISTGACAQQNMGTLQTDNGVKVRVENLTDGLNHPWGMAFLPDGRLLVTERNTGKLYILGTDNKLSGPLKGTPEVFARGQGGLMDVSLHPDFEKNRYVYLSYAKSGPGGAATALGRGRLDNGAIEGFEDIFIQEPYTGGANHFGNRIEFSPDGGHLFLGLGERFKFDPAQELDNHLGTVIRIYPDGRVPDDNPFAGRDNAEPEIWSYGHRNIEAMAFQPATGALWVGEMGPKGGDELNRVEKGANYGWPVVSWGDHYDGREIPDPPARPDFNDAARHWTPVISPSGMAFYRGGMFPEWKGRAIIGGLTHKELVILSFDGTDVVDEDRLQLSKRIRDVDVGPDGSIYVLTDADDGDVWRITPADD